MINWWPEGLAGFRIDAIINIKKALPIIDYCYSTGSRRRHCRATWDAGCMIVGDTELKKWLFGADAFCSRRSDGMRGSPFSSVTGSYFSVCLTSARMC